MTDENVNVAATADDGAEDALEAAVENEAEVEELIADVEGDDAATDAVEAIAEVEDIEPDGVLVEAPAELDAALDELAEAEAILDEAEDEVAEEAVEEIAADAVAEEVAEELVDEAVAAEADAAADAEVLDEEELLEEEAPAPKPESPYDRPGKWYVLHTQSGYENKVRQNIEARRASMNMESRIHEVVIPMEDVVEFKQGKKVVVQKKMFPGYLLVRCSLDDDSWYVIRNTPGVTGFVGAGNKPQPLPRKDVENFLQVKDETQESVPSKSTRPRLEYEINETVRVKEGPFADFSGEIVEINEDQLKVKVLVNIFGRETPVELEFSQVAKL
ncbi:transcription termination/antitermination protein NusG [Dermatobacter hominis]|uniref:transcription termination/antitermination protein NusG n=1 Tax=Dermatobacter hominis TaxID=2884263 RepID=UPI001D11BAEF|nr:transcription termination/antitermination protein NusG [Dermatobacter hominis]UDY33898.1 transcription termination/antitermination protein NusG [Dermatobacter hominis]